MKRLVIIGGGITGLAAAHELCIRGSNVSRRGIQVELLEKSDRLGGKIWTQKHGDFLLEAGPDSFLTTQPQAYDLCRELGLGGDLLASNQKQNDIFLLRQGRLKRLPDGLNSMIPSRFWPLAATTLLSWPQKLRALGDLVLPRKSDEADESVHDFFCRRLGRGIFETLIEPLLAGVYAGDARELSLKSALPQIYELEQRHRSLILGMMRQARLPDKKMRSSAPGEPPRTMFMTLKNGLSQLPLKMAGAIGDQVIHRQSQATRIRRQDQGYLIDQAHGSSIRADAVLLAAPAQESGIPLETLDAAMSVFLKSWPRTSSAVVTLVYHKEDVGRELAGFGFLAPKSEGKAILGSTWTAMKFPGRTPEGFAVFRFFLGGSGREAVVAQDDAFILNLVKEEARGLLRISGEPKVQALQRWIEGNPLYRVGHGARLRQLESLLERHPGLFLAGASYRGVGIPNCISQGREAAQKIRSYFMV
ncbi:MAG: protoporphyrinogen oxidase [Elusimicrobia bacterium]|nr:protoporphyrinogen oxidase [Elusimicrobiota bacterium]